MEKRRGCGVLFYDPIGQRILCFLRDNKPGIPFPNHVDLIGGHVEEGETPEEAARREIAEEMLDLRTGKPFVLDGHALFDVYIDERDTEHHIFYKEADFDIADVKFL